MKRLQFKTSVNAPAKRVYDLMLGISNIRTYEQWTAAFNPTSTYEGKWQKGSKMLFVGVGENGKRGGMVSEIAAANPGEFVSIRHNGFLDGDKEITTGPEVEKWAGGLENYTFTEKNNVTTVTVDIDVTEDYESYFTKTYPEALKNLKEMAERH